MKRFLLASLMGMLIVNLAFGVDIKSNIGEQDINFGSGTFQRRTSTGGTIQLNRIPHYFSVEAFTDGLTLYGNDLIVKNSPYVDVRAWDITTSSAAAANTAAWNNNIAANKKVKFPAGTFNFSSTIYFYDNVVIEGAGKGQTILLFAVTGTTPAIAKHTSLGVVNNPSIGKLTIKGTDGSGGVGLRLDSVNEGYFPNLIIDMFRNASDNGIGLYMTNDNGVCARNKFVGLTVNNSDNGIVLDSTNGTYSVGYNTFIGTAIGQEVNSVRLLSTNANGGIYNTFYGLFFQGNSGAGTYLDIEGSGNEIRGVILDSAGSGTHVSFTKTTTQGNFVTWLTGLDASKIVNNHVTGAPNTIIGNTQYYGTPGKTYGLTDPLGPLTFSLQSAGATDALDIYMGNGTASNLWRWAMQGSATPTWTLMYGASVSTQWNRSGDMTVVGISKGNSVQLTATDNTLPTCDSDARGKIFNSQGGAGVADNTSICIKNAAGSYEWKVLW